MESVPRFVRILSDDRDALSRSDVVARNPVILEGNCVEVLGDDLLTARESVAATHMGNCAESA
jgi:hypothetical protein